MFPPLLVPERGLSEEAALSLSLIIFSILLLPAAISMQLRRLIPESWVSPWQNLHFKVDKQGLHRPALLPPPTRLR